MDLWAAGLILAEMYILRTVFSSENNLDQFTEMIRLLGTPTKKEIRHGDSISIRTNSPLEIPVRRMVLA